MRGAGQGANKDSLTVKTNVVYTLDFLTGKDSAGDWTNGTTGLGRPTRVYGPNSVETKEMMNSYGGKEMQEAFKNGGCKDIVHGEFGTYKAAATTLYDPSNTAWVVGAFDYDATSMPDGTVQYRMYNKTGKHSLFYHLPFVHDSERPGPMGTIRERFEASTSSTCAAGTK